MPEPGASAHVIDTHRHHIGPTLRQRMVARGLWDDSKPLPQANAQDIVQDDAGPQ